jgi:hypothetical protein
VLGADQRPVRAPRRRPPVDGRQSVPSQRHEEIGARLLIHLVNHDLYAAAGPGVTGVARAVGGRYGVSTPALENVTRSIGTPVPDIDHGFCGAAARASCSAETRPSVRN